MTQIATAAEHETTVDLAPPFWGWQKYSSPKLPGFWRATNFEPEPGVVVNQLGREGSLNVGVQTAAFRTTVDFGPASFLMARIKVVSLSAIGPNIRHYVYAQAGGSFSHRRVYPGQSITLYLRASGQRVLSVGNYQVQGLASRYGEIISEITDLDLTPGAGIEDVTADQPRAVSADADVNAALLAALDGGKAETIPFDARG